jgi:hypothetical protein
MSIFGTILRPFFGVSQKEATDFGMGNSKAALRLETVVFSVTKGCHITFQNSNFEALVARMKEFDPELRGYAYEGVGIGLMALDCMLPWKNRIKAFLAGPGAPYPYAVHIGAGLALARVHVQPEKFLKRLDPILGWIALDGYGFHKGFFSRKSAVEKQVVPRHLSAYGRRVFDHGIGRSIWFVSGADVEQIAATIAAFPKERQADLWSGVGLGCGYTGGVGREALEKLRVVSGLYLLPLAVGVAIAAHARRLADTPAPYAELASEILCNTSIDGAAHMVEVACIGVPTNHTKPAYQIWRERIEEQLVPLVGNGVEQKTQFA